MIPIWPYAWKVGNEEKSRKGNISLKMGKRTSWIHGSNNFLFTIILKIFFFINNKIGVLF